MVKLTDIQEDFDLMKEDFERIGCYIKLYGGMRARGSSDHDIDIIIRMMNTKTPKELQIMCEKWSRFFLGKHGVSIDAVIQTKGKKHLYDFDHRVGICKAKESIVIDDKAYSERQV